MNHKYFTVEELAKSSTATKLGIDNTPTKEIKSNIHLLISTILDPLREEYGSPIICTSGFRCEELNAAVGGSKTSQHLYGEAADIVPANGKTRELWDLIISMIQNNTIQVGQLIWEYGTKQAPKWVHISLPTERHNNEIKYIGI